MTKVYIIGSKGIPAKYGGFETFVDKLTEYKVDKQIDYVVACMKENSIKSGFYDDIFKYNQATCYNINVPNIGPARAIYYDILALSKAIEMSKKNSDLKPIFYVLACRIGPFITYFKKRIEKLGGILIVNPDGHEWLRAKWSLPVRKYWKISEALMIKYSDLIICDSKNIENYIKEQYYEFKPRTSYIAYGTDIEKSNLDEQHRVVREWFHLNDIIEGEYYLVVGRFVPENNYESILRGFIASDSKKDLVIITNVEENRFYSQLKNNTNFQRDSRVKFVGTVYNQELLKYIRQNAFAYFHGHEVGGTNPSLLEALASTDLNLLLNVGFNKEVAENGALYWEKNTLKDLINSVEKLNLLEIKKLSVVARDRISEKFSWKKIISDYELLWRSLNENK